jgi:hypothetical protein
VKALLAIGVLSVALGASLVNPPGAAAAGPTSTGIHIFAGIQSNQNATQAEAVAAARMADKVYGLAVQIRAYGAAMRQAHPGVGLYVYVNGELAQSKDCSTFPASWYLYGKGGVKVKSGTTGNCAMYPLSKQLWNGYAGWVDYVQHLCKQELAQAPLANGCFVDQISSALDSGFATTLPIDPATGALYTSKTWMSQMGMIGARIQSFTGKPVIGNSYEGGGRYWGVPTNVVNGYAVTGFESEHFLNADSSQWTQLSSWMQNINMMIDGQAHGKAVHVAFTDAPATTEEAWREYVTASYLLGNNGNAWLAFCASGKHTYNDPSPLYKLPIGAPSQTASSVAGYAIRSGVFLRRFTNGVAVVNLSGTTTTVSLGATYRDVSGKSYTSVTLGTGRGIVLAK